MSLKGKMIKKIRSALAGVVYLKKNLGYGKLKDALVAKIAFTVRDEVEKEKILVLSPHPDDDVFGCGGTIARYAAQQSQIKIIYLANGSLGFPTKVTPTEKEKKEMASKREHEAKASAAIIGVDDLEFWRFKDGSLKANETITKLMTELLNKYQPKIVFLPSSLDDHPDHQATTEIFLKSLKNINIPGLKICFYEVWTPLVPNRLIIIDETIEKKKQAINCHKSQLSSRSYFEAIIGLSEYRAGLAGRGKYAEAFFEIEAEKYLKLFEV